MEILYNNIQNLNGINIINTIILLFISFLMKEVATRILHKKIDDIKIFYKVKKIIVYIIFIITISGIFIIWMDTNHIGTYFGLLSAGLAIALKDLFVNIAAWFFIILKKPFSVGDRIEINGVAGDVIDQRLFQFTLMEIGNWVENDQSTGRMVHIPNVLVFCIHWLITTVGLDIYGMKFMYC